MSVYWPSVSSGNPAALNIIHILMRWKTQWKRMCGVYLTLHTWRGYLPNRHLRLNIFKTEPSLSTPAPTCSPHSLLPSQMASPHCLKPNLLELPLILPKNTPLSPIQSTWIPSILLLDISSTRPLLSISTATTQTQIPIQPGLLK